ncbi:MAG: hypothetical protein R2883_01280 [Caldisericia bacterium]
MANGNKNRIRPEWRVIIDTLRITNNAQYKRVCRKLLYVLYRKGARGAEKLIQEFNQTKTRIGFETEVGENVPLPMTKEAHLDQIRNETIGLADKYLDNADVNESCSWVGQKNNVSFLTTTINDPTTPFNVESTLDRYFSLPKYEQHLTMSNITSLFDSKVLSDSLTLLELPVDL